MKISINQNRLLAFVVLTTICSTHVASAQYFGWASNQYFSNYGSYIDAISKDESGNFFVKGSFRICLGCQSDYYLNMYAQDGQLITGIHSLESDEFRYTSAATDISGQVYFLGYSTFDTENIVKMPTGSNLSIGFGMNYNTFKIDASGNLFVSNNSIVRKYNPSGVLVYERAYASSITMQIDDYGFCYISTPTLVIKLNSVGTDVLQVPVDGTVVVDDGGRFYVHGPSGLKKLSKFGVLQWHRPLITGKVQITDNLHIFESQGNILNKYNQNGTVLQWSFNTYGNAVIGETGGIVSGGNYSGVPSNIRPCPYSLGFGQGWSQNQAWLGGIVDGQPAIPQVVVYTGVPFTNNGNPLFGNQIQYICSGKQINTSFDYCVTGNNPLPAGHQFTLELTGTEGTFNLGNVDSALMPVLSTIGNYRFYVRSNQVGSISYPNESFPNEYAMMISNYSYYPNQVNLSVIGPVNMCEDQPPLTITLEKPAYCFSWGWRKDGAFYGNGTSDSIDVNTSGTYSVLIESPYCGMAPIPTVDVNVHERPNPVVSSSGPLSFCSGDSVTLTVSDIDLSVVRWRESGAAIPGEIYSDISVSTSGIYTARVINANGCARSSDPLIVDVNCREFYTEAPDRKFHIYPNPAIDVLNIQFDEVSNTNVIEISDVSGKVLLKQNNTGNLIDQINTANLVPGVYLVKISNSSGVFSDKFVKTL